MTYDSKLYLGYGMLEFLQLRSYLQRVVVEVYLQFYVVIFPFEGVSD